MGITIHYQGHLDSPDDIHYLIDEFQDIANSMKWEYHILDEDWSQPSTATLSWTKNGVEIVGDLGLKGISLNLHPDCESLSLFFDADGTMTTIMNTILMNEGTIDRGTSYCTVKTQFAPPDIHISIVNILKYVKKRYVSDLEVTDEGEYWETKDRNILEQRIQFLNEKMSQLEDEISNIPTKNDWNYSAEDLVTLLEECLRRWQL